MRQDKFNNPIFNETDVFNLLYQENTSVLPHLTVDINQELVKLENVSGIQFKDYFPVEHFSNIEDFDKRNQQQWFIPEKYKDLTFNHSV